MDESRLDTDQFTSEIEHGHDAYSDEELLELAQFNAQALLMAAANAVPAEQRDVWTKGVAAVFARGWEDRAWEAAEILDALLTNYRSFGGEVIEADLDADVPFAVVAGIPDVELAESLGTSDADADALFTIGEHLARGLGASMYWTRDAETGDVRIEVQ